MKRTDRIKRGASETMEKIRNLTRHIRNVEDNCLLLGTALIECGEIDLGRQLIANGYVHDASKFYGIEFDYLAKLSNANMKEETAKLKMKMAVQHHQKTNPHHVEYWSNGIKDMPLVYIAEMVCDIKARSEEFGTSFKEWIDVEGLKRWGIIKNDNEYEKIMKYANILCGEPFQKIN